MYQILYEHILTYVTFLKLQVKFTITNNLSIVSVGNIALSIFDKIEQLHRESEDSGAKL